MCVFVCVSVYVTSAKRTGMQRLQNNVAHIHTNVRCGVVLMLAHGGGQMLAHSQMVPHSLMSPIVYTMAHMDGRRMCVCVSGPSCSAGGAAACSAVQSLGGLMIFLYPTQRFIYAAIRKASIYSAFW